MKFGDLQIGARFTYRGKMFVKAGESLATKIGGQQTIFHGDAEVETGNGKEERLRKHDRANLDRET
jgi:hypothetical protein